MSVSLQIQRSNYDQRYNNRAVLPGGKPDTQTGSQGEDCLHPAFSRISLYTEQSAGLCDRNHISWNCDQDVQSAVKIYR